MKTFSGIAAAGWLIAAAALIGDGSTGLLGDPPNQEVLGDPVVMAIHLVARILFVALGIRALADVDPEALKRLLQ